MNIMKLKVHERLHQKGLCSMGFNRKIALLITCIAHMLIFPASRPSARRTLWLVSLHIPLATPLPTCAFWCSVLCSFSRIVHDVRELTATHFVFFVFCSAGSLMIDVFIRNNFTADSNAMMVGFLREFADVLSLCVRLLNVLRHKSVMHVMQIFVSNVTSVYLCICACKCTVVCVLSLGFLVGGCEIGWVSSPASLTALCVGNSSVHNSYNVCASSAIHPYTASFLYIVCGFTTLGWRTARQCNRGSKPSTTGILNGNCNECGLVSGSVRISMCTCW